MSSEAPGRLHESWPLVPCPSKGDGPPVSVQCVRVCRLSVTQIALTSVRSTALMHALASRVAVTCSWHRSVAAPREESSGVRCARKLLRCLSSLRRVEALSELSRAAWGRPSPLRHWLNLDLQALSLCAGASATPLPRAHSTVYILV